MLGIRRGYRGMRKSEFEEIYFVRIGFGSTFRFDLSVLEVVRFFIERDEVELEIRERKFLIFFFIKVVINERYVMF